MTTTLDSGILRGFQHTLEKAGWETLAVEVDLTTQTARIELRRSDGRLITLDARNGKATVTREHLGTRTELMGRRGDQYRSEVIDVQFLGRSDYTGLRSAMRGLANYVMDNSTTPLMGGREVFRSLLNSDEEE